MPVGYDYFGISVAAYGNTMVIGASNKEAGKGAGRHFSLGDHSRQAGDGKPSSPRHSVGKHRAAESGGK